MDRTNRRGSRRGTSFDNSSPHDFAAERAMLAVLLLDPGRIAEVAAALAVRPGNSVSCSVKD